MGSKKLSEVEMVAMAMYCACTESPDSPEQKWHDAGWSAQQHWREQASEFLRALRSGR